MTNASDTIKTGYFNALVSSSFKVTEDGRRLFYPWGVLGHGYEIPTEQDFERLQRQIKIYMIVSLVLIVAPIAARFFITGLITCAVLTAFYIAWTPYLLRGLKRSDVRLTLRDSATAQARRHHAVILWLLLITSIMFVAGGIVMLVLQPAMWPTFLPAVLFFSPCAAIFVWMLAIRRRLNRTAA